MLGLLMVGKIAKIELARTDDEFDNIVFEIERYDNRLERKVPDSQSAILFKDCKHYLNNILKYQGQVVALPVVSRKSKSGHAYLAVTGDLIDLSSVDVMT